jgi:uncharacterized protein
MNRFFERLRPVIRGVISHAFWVLLAAVILTVLSVRLAMNLKIDTDLANLIPPSYPSSQALERLRDTVGGESEASVVIESSSFEANLKFAEALIPRGLALKGEGYDEAYFQRVEFRKDTEFLKDNALYFATPAELDLLDTWLDDKIEQAKLEASPFYFDLDEDEVEADSVGEELSSIYNEIVSKEYPISDDSLTMVLRFFPVQASSDVQFIEDAYQDLETEIAALDPSSYGSNMKITTAGRLLRQLIEVQTIQRDVLGSFGSGMMAVLMLVVLYFFYKSYSARAGRSFQPKIFFAEILRMPIMALTIGVPLLMSLSWTFGLAYLTFGQLNLMTSTLGLVLFGLGIDFGIHFYARYSEERASGLSIIDAAERTFASTGQAITIGAMTTALALFVLVLADFRGFSQFGFIAGAGILFALVAMLFVMPALLSLFEKARLLNLNSAAKIATQDVSSAKRFPAARSILVVSSIAIIAAIAMLPRVSFEYRFGELEPSYDEYDARHEIEKKVYSDKRRRNPAYVVVDSADEIQPITNVLNDLIVSDTLSPTINRVESLQDRFPVTTQTQETRLTFLSDLREKLSDPFLDIEENEDMARLKRAASTNRVLAFEEVPEFLRKQFTSKTGELGNFVIIYPSVGLSDGRASIAFSEDVGTIETKDGTVYHAGSTSLVAADMLKLMRREAPWMVFATFAIVLMLMYLNFTTIRWTSLAVLPLVVGVLWMLLAVEFVDVKLNFYNLIVLPAVLGIGNDAGVHIIHRYQEEGPGSIWRVLRSTGEHVAMGSLTTMVGFAGLLLSFHPGLESIGMLAVIGIGATLLAALVFLPALLQWLEDRAAV